MKLIEAFVLALLISLGGNFVVWAEEGTLPQTEESKAISIETGYKDNFYLKTMDNKFRLDIYGYGQVRYTYQTNDITAKDDLSNFQVQRVRLGLKGFVYSDKLKYQLVLSASQSGEFDKVSLLDWFIDYSPVNEFGVRAGQFKVPYSTSFTISASELQFVERTQVDSNFRLDRDNGINLYGKVINSRFTYNLGIYNGEGRNKTNPDNGNLYSGRLIFEPMGKYPYHESDNERSDQPIVMLSAAFATSKDQADSSNTNLSGRLASTALGVSDVTSYNAFIGVKYRGASLHGEYYQRAINPEKNGISDETGDGYYIQAGYFVVPKIVEVAARYESFDPNKDKNNDKRNEYGGGINYFFKGHRNKIQADFFKIKDEAGKNGDDDSRLRVQYQLSF
ncbi:MAG: porin [Nitrospirota bacterium]